jgi:aminoglycoside 6-adenylyltransferase
VEPIAGWSDLEDRLIRHFDADDNVRSVAVVGSRARGDRPADLWSDLDLLVAASDPAALIETGEWLEEIAPVWVTLAHDGPIAGVRVRQVLFAGGYDVDIAPLPAGDMAALFADPGVADVVGRGMRILVDKDGEMVSLSPAAPAAVRPPATQDRYTWTVADFLFQCVWATKHLCRGELWLAKDDVDGYMKQRLLSMIEWQALETGRDVATWAGATSGGRLLERWADPSVLADLPAAFARFDGEDIGRALLVMMSLFRRVSEQVAGLSGFSYPTEAHDAIEQFVRSHLDGQPASSTSAPPVR